MRVQGEKTRQEGLEGTGEGRNLREASVLQEDGADGFRGRDSKRYFEPLEDVWGPSDDDDIEDEECAEDDGDSARAYGGA